MCFITNPLIVMEDLYEVYCCLLA